ncbi:MAG: DUF4250 domain-containing protein [Clostridia bacterium]|nr:DUF4250 domain-containing protein [Clostridia bacterium]
MNLPADDFILLSLVNTKLRDNYCSLSELCDEENVPLSEIEKRLSALGYKYDKDKNAFIRF